MKLIQCLCVVVCLFTLGCPTGPDPSPGGLNANDFVQVATNGFDAVDQAVDFNDYPWSMDYYVPDAKADVGGHVYVGTWNKVQQWKGFQDHAPVFPEIRRYRPDLGPQTWERVLDTRDLGLSETERPHGFRYLEPYRNQSDGKKYLYAGGRGDTVSLWRSETGAPGTWENFWQYNFEGSIRSMAVHNGLLYMAWLNDYAIFDSGDGPKAVIFATDGETVWTVMDDAFGDHNNIGLFEIAAFNGYLWAGTHNRMQGCEVWRLEGPDPNEGPVRVMANGGARAFNEAAMTMFEFKDHLYVGTISNFIWRFILGLKPTDVYRIDRNDNVETVVGPNSVGGEPAGFGHRGNAYMWSMCELDGWLYVGTYDIITGLTYMYTHPDFLMAIMGLKNGDLTSKLLTIFDLAVSQGQAGADLYKSQDGVKWYRVFDDGLGNPNNYGIRVLTVAEGRMFAAMSNPYDGLEVWASKEPVAAP